MAGIVAVAVVSAGAFDLSTPHPSPGTTVLGLVSALALVGRSVAPRLTLAVVAVLGVLPTLVVGSTPDLYASFVPVLAAVYAVAARCPTRQTALVPAVAVTVVVVFRARVPAFETVSQVVFTGSGLVLAYAAGRTTRLLRHRADVEAARADLMDRERELQAREAVVAERERIARELHDVIAHDVAVMVISAGATERLLPDRSGPVAQSLAQIQSSGRKAIDELHLLLGMLRDDDQALVVPPGLHALGPLVEEVSRVGLPVRLEVVGAARDVGAALDVSAYRLVQEALTNVLKHAGGSHTRVVVEYGATAMTISVEDDGDGSRPGPTDPSSSDPVSPSLASSGRGLVGMRERVRLFGGSLAAGATPAGGWAVTAVLPIPEASR